jgi:mono/diheme cytochrome c family protein
VLQRRLTNILIAILPLVLLTYACSDKGSNPENLLPQITSASTVTAIVDMEFSYTATATDPDGTTPMIHFENIPGWLDTSGVVISGTPDSSTVDTSFAVIAEDSLGADTLEVTVNVLAEAQLVSYAGDIQPIFNAHCASCHIESGSGGLHLGNYTQLMQGGSSGAVIAPGNPNNSLLVKRIEGTIQPRMPQGGAALPSTEIQKIRDWIEQGAEDN